jgi:hypothetical protein
VESNCLYTFFQTTHNFVDKYNNNNSNNIIKTKKPEGKRPLARPRRRWEDNIKMDVQKVGGDCRDWRELAQDRDRWRALMGTERNLRVPKMRRIS